MSKKIDVIDFLRMMALNKWLNPEERRQILMKYWQDGLERTEKIIEVDADRLKPFRNHPFHVRADRQLKQLTDSIKQFGILNPLLIRPTLEGCYEIISGHRRLYVAKQLGYQKVPVIIRVLSDNEAEICMVDSNIQREQLSFSEKAFTYKMKSEAIQRITASQDSSQVDHPEYKGKRTIEILGEESGKVPSRYKDT